MRKTREGGSGEPFPSSSAPLLLSFHPTSPPPPPPRPKTGEKFHHARAREERKRKHKTASARGGGGGKGKRTVIRQHEEEEEEELEGAAAAASHRNGIPLSFPPSLVRNRSFLLPKSCGDGAYQQDRMGDEEEEGGGVSARTWHNNAASVARSIDLGEEEEEGRREGEGSPGFLPSFLMSEGKGEG